MRKEKYFSHSVFLGKIVHYFPSVIMNSFPHWGGNEFSSYNNFSIFLYKLWQFLNNNYRHVRSVNKVLYDIRVITHY